MDKNFEHHKASLVLEQDGFYIIDFRREDGSSHYYVRFIIDTNRSSVFIEGDLGHSISCWYNKNDLAVISNMMLNVPYWIGKFCCTSDDFIYDEKLARKELEEMTYDSYCEMDHDEYYEHIDNIMDTFNYVHGIMFDTYDARDSYAELLGPDAIYERPYYGRRICNRVYLWAEALDAALKQLGLK